MITWWRGLANEAKQILFVAGTILAGLYLMGIGLWVMTGHAGLFVAVAFISGAVFTLVGLLLIAGRLFPGKEAK